MNDVARSHQTDKYWLESFMEKKYETLPDDLDLEASLKHLGFTASRAKFLTDLLSANPLHDHQSVFYWASQYIEYHFNHHILFSGKPASCKDSCEDEGHFKIYTEIEDEEEDTSVEIDAVKLVSDTEEYRQITADYKAQNETSLTNTKYFFHGTDHHSATNIAKHGINLSKGKGGGDFSNNNGFYTTSDFKFALNWSKKMRKQSNAIVVFKLEEKSWEKSIFAGIKGIKFPEDNEGWSEAVKYFRHAQDDEYAEQQRISISKRKSLRSSKYIFGPISMDGSNKQRSNWTPRARRKDKDRRNTLENIYFQLCLKDEDLVDQFYDKGKNIEKVLFF